MPLHRFLQSVSGTCRHCGQNASFLRKQHGQCRQTHQSGMNEMTQLAAQAAGTSSFNETALRSTLQAIADRARATPDDISQAIATGFAQGVKHAMQDGTLTQEEETNLRAFRDRMADQDLPSVITGFHHPGPGFSRPDHRHGHTHHPGSRRRRHPPGAGQRPPPGHDVQHAPPPASHQAWEEAVEGAIEDGLLSLDEENTLSQYLDHFDLTTTDVNLNGAHTSVVQAGVIRDVTMGIIPQRQNITGRVPFNLMKSEQLVWVIDGVDYLETLVRRERRGTSHGISVRVARGLYYRPSTFRSRPIEWEETVHADTGLLN